MTSSESQPRTDGPSRELTPDEIVADIEAMKPRKRKVTIYQSWPRMILERERKRAEAAAGPPASAERVTRDLVTLIRLGWLTQISDRRPNASDVREPRLHSLLVTILGSVDTDSAVAALEAQE